MNELSPLGAGALRLAQAGIPVFPMRPGGKEPLTAHGFLEATTDETQVKAWWTRCPDANVGMPTGPRSRVFVLDLDRRPDKDGFATLSEIEATDPLPTTLTVSTAGGGEHRWFTWDERLAAASSKAGKLGPGIDWRGAGGCVVVPPSEMNGGCWQRIGDCTRPVPLPESWIARILAASGARRAEPQVNGSLIQAGQRNDTLFRIASAMRARGATEDQILEDLRLERCDPPLSETELRQIAHSAMRYEPGDFTRGAVVATDVRAAERFAHGHRGQLVYVPKEATWYECGDDGLWREDPGTGAQARAKETVRQMHAEAAEEPNDKRREALGKWALQSECVRKIRAMIELSEDLLAADPSEFDADPWLLSCANGVLDLRTLELRERRPEDRMRRSTGCDYVPGVRCPLLDAAIERAFPDPEVRAFWWRMAGYALLGVQPHRALFTVYGPTATGKSTLMRLLERAMGSYTATTNLVTFTGARQAGAASPDLARLPGARLLLVHETLGARAVRSDLIKSWTGNDLITARALHSGEITFRPQATIVFVGNDRPRVDLSDDAAWDRVMPIPIENPVPKKDRDPHFDEKVDPSAMLGGAVSGLRDLLARDALDPPETLLAAREKHRDESDPLADFLEAEFEQDEDSRVPKGALRSALTRWWGDQGLAWADRPGTTALTRRLGRLGIKLDAGRRDYLGIRDRRGQIPPN